MSKRVSFRVFGTVQGVFFRDFTQKKANGYGLTGWVRNTLDGNVEGEAQGDEGLLKKLLSDVEKGPRMAEVTKLEKSEINPKEGEIKFQVVR